MKIFTIKLLVAATPLLLVILFTFFVADGYLSFDSDKDIVLMIPFLILSIIYLVAFVILWWQKNSLYSAVWISFTLATVFSIFISVPIFFGISWLKF